MKTVSERIDHILTIGTGGRKTLIYIKPNGSREDWRPEIIPDTNQLVFETIYQLKDVIKSVHAVEEILKDVPMNERGKYGSLDKLYRGYEKNYILLLDQLFDMEYTNSPLDFPLHENDIPKYLISF